jgi:tape measure domain-containing protein
VALNGSIVITTKVDTAQAENNLKGLVVGIKTVEKEQVAAAKAAEEHALKMQRVADVSRTAAIGLGVFGAALGAAAIGSIKLAADLEQSRVAFTTLLGSGEKARKFLDELAAFAASTPFEFRELQDASRRLLAFGFNAKDIIPIMNSVGGAAAGLGLGKEGIDRMTLALGQMQAKGKVSAQEMNQLAEAGVPAWEMLAKAIGVGIPEAMKLGEKGAIDSTTAINALVAGMNAKFPGMLEKQSQTINGQLSNLRDGVTLTATLIGEKLISAFHITDAVRAAAEAVSGFGRMIKTGGLKEAVDAAFPPGLQAILVGIAGALTASLIPALGLAATAFGTAVVAAAPFLAVGAGIAAAAYLIIKNWEPVSGFFSDLFGKIGKMAEDLRDTIVGALGGPVAQLGGSGRSSMRLSQAGATIKPAKIEKAVAQPIDYFAGFKNLFGEFVPDLKKIMDTTVKTVVNTKFTGLSGKAPAPAAAAGDGGKKAREQAEKEQLDSAQRVADAQAKLDEEALRDKERLKNQEIEYLKQVSRERERIEREAQQRTATGLREAYGLALNLIAGDFQTFFTTIASKIGDTIFQTLASNPAIQQAMEGVTNSVTGTVSQMVSGLLGGGLDAAGAAVAGGMPGIMASFSGLGAVLAPLLPIIVAIGAAIVIFQQVWDQNVAYIQENFAALGQAVAYLWDTVMSALQPVIDIVGSALSALAGPLTLVAFVLDTVIGAFSGVFKAVWDAINAFAPLKFIIDGISWVMNGLIDASLAVVNWFRKITFQPPIERDKTTGAIGMAPPAAGAPTEIGDFEFVDGKWRRKGSSGQYDRVRGPSGAFEFKPKAPPETKPAAMPGETPDRPIYTQVVNVRDFREAFPDSAYFRAPSVDTTRSLNANAVAYR